MDRSTVLLAVALVFFGVFSVRLKADLAADRGDSEVLDRGEPAPEFTLERLDGGEVTLAEVAAANKVVVLNFWATWCQPCRIEMPALERAYREHRESGLEILAITTEEREIVEGFLASRSYSYPILIDPGGAITERYGVTALPTTVIVDAEGRVMQSQRGLNPALEVMLGRLVEQER